MSPHARLRRRGRPCQSVRVSMSSADPCGGATSPDDRSVCAIVCCLHMCARRGLLSSSLYASTGRAHVWHVVPSLLHTVPSRSTRGGVRVVGPCVSSPRAVTRVGGARVCGLWRSVGPCASLVLPPCPGRAS